MIARIALSQLAKHSLSLRQLLAFPLRVRVGVHAGQALQNPKSMHRNPLGMVFPKGDPSGSPRFLCNDTNQLSCASGCHSREIPLGGRCLGLGGRSGLHPPRTSPVRSLKVRPSLMALRHILFKVEDHLSHLSNLSQSSVVVWCVNPTSQHSP